MEITDINCMLGSLPQQQHFTDREGLYAAMDSYRITKAVAYHADALWDAWRGNAAAREAAASPDGRLQACYVLRPNLGGAEMPDAETLLARLREERPAAVKLCPPQDGYPFTRFYCGELLEVLNTLRLPVLVTYDLSLAGHLPALAQDFPQIPFVAVHVPHRQSNVILPLVRQLDNVYIDTCTVVDTGLIEEIVRRYGSRQLLYGSGMPFFMPAGSLGLLLYARISDDDRAGILAGNWQALQEALAWQ